MTDAEWNNLRDRVKAARRGDGRGDALPNESSRPRIQVVRSCELLVLSYDGHRPPEEVKAVGDFLASCLRGVPFVILTEGWNLTVVSSDGVVRTGAMLPGSDDDRLLPNSE